MNRIHAAAALLCLLVVADALPSYTGYSGAPGSDGTCASSCHGVTGGTITIAGFPTLYLPGHTYLVTVGHHSGSSIKNLNASVRIGTGTQTAGTITADLNTETYSTPGEPNGVHLASNNQDSCKFNWAAPNPGVGIVTLYLAGYQGSSMSGQNTEATLTAGQGTGINGREPAARQALELRLEPTVVTRYLALRIINAGPAQARVRMVDPTGRIVARVAVPGMAATQSVLWQPFDRDNRRLAAGAYLAVLDCGSQRVVRRFAVR